MGAFAGPAEWWTDSTSDGRNHIATKGIVQSGLVVNLDAGTLASYPGSGSTWTNLAPSATNIGNATLRTDEGYNLNGYAGITTSESQWTYILILVVEHLQPLHIRFGVIQQSLVVINL